MGSTISIEMPRGNQAPWATSTRRGRCWAWVRPKARIFGTNSREHPIDWRHKPKPTKPLAGMKVGLNHEIFWNFYRRCQQKRGQSDPSTVASVKVGDPASFLGPRKSSHHNNNHFNKTSWYNLCCNLTTKYIFFFPWNASLFLVVCLVC